jgi:hypothetical protein
MKNKENCKKFSLNNDWNFVIVYFTKFYEFLIEIKIRIILKLKLKKIDRVRDEGK